jgi:hypothetical protein
VSSIRIPRCWFGTPHELGKGRVRTTVEELDALLCQIESRIKKTPVFKAGAFLYANKSGARGVGGMGKAPDLWLLWRGDYSESV